MYKWMYDRMVTEYSKFWKKNMHVIKRNPMI